MSQHDVLILDAVINMLKLYADALNAIASVEKVSGRRADELLRELLAPQNLAKLSQRLSPDMCLWRVYVGAVKASYTSFCAESVNSFT